MRCAAEVRLKPREVEQLNKLAGREWDVDRIPLDCDFTDHDDSVRHTACVQAQNAHPGDPDGPMTVWWLIWDEEGHRELATAAECSLGQDTDDPCMLIADHPGPCDHYDQLTEQLHQHRKDHE